MARVVAGLLAVMMLSGGTPASARGGHHGGGLFGHVRHGHPINAWMGSRHLRLR